MFRKGNEINNGKKEKLTSNVHAHLIFWDKIEKLICLIKWNGGSTTY